MNTINFARYKNIIILTGAGVSVASGIRPFRGKDGLWQQPELERLSHAQSFHENPGEVWRFWGEMRGQALQAQPNPAHLALAEIERRLRPDQQFLLVTQNIDGLHQRAGSRNVVELHGSIFRSRCSNEACALEPFTDLSAVKDGALPACPLCGAVLRPDIVMFGEPLPVDAEWRSKRALRDCDLFLAIGTSGKVSPAADFVRGAEYAGARTIFINPEPMNPPNRYFKETLLLRAEELESVIEI